MRKKRFDNLDSIMQFGSPMNCRFSFGGGGGAPQQAPADNSAERLLREEVTTSSEEAEAVAVQQDVESPEGISIDFMAALQAGMQDLYPE